VVQAEPVQYGLLNSRTALDCSTTLDKFIFLVDITWYRGEGTGRIEMSSPQLEGTELSDEGVYTCKVNINEVGAVIEKIINFLVIGKYSNYCIGLIEL
jgi:hypothetical protein